MYERPICPMCENALTAWGAVSHGDGDISDEYGCDYCGEPRLEIHAVVCECSDCQVGVGKEHWLAIRQ